MTKQVGNSGPRTEACPEPRRRVRGLAGVYYVWFSPRRRKAALQGPIDTTVREAIHRIAAEHAIELLEMETRWDHVHLLLRLPPQLTLARAMQYLKGISAHTVFLAFPELKLDLGHEHLWQRGYGYRRIDRAAIRRVAEYIRNHRVHRDEEPRTSVRGVVRTGQVQGENNG